MKRYPHYQPSGVKWIGDVPEHWGKLRSKNLFIRMNRPVEPDDEVITCFRDGEVTLRKNRRTEGFTESFKEIGYQGIRPGDLVVHQMDAFAGAIGVSDSKGKGTPVYICLQPREGVCNWYYAYLLREMARTGYIKSLYRGIRERSSDFRFETLGRLFLPVPPQEEQSDIVKYIDRKEREIDEYIAAKEAEIEKLGTLKQSVISRAVTRGLNPNAPMKDSKIPWIGDVPEHWGIMRLAVGFAENKSKNSDYLYHSALQFYYGTLVSKNEVGDLSDLRDTYEDYTVLKQGDIVINGLNLNYDFASLRVAQAPCAGIITSAYLVITPREGVNSDFYTYFFKAMDARKIFHGMGTGIRLTLSYSELKKQPILVPPADEQQAIVEYIDRKIREIDGYIGKIREQIEKLKIYKQRLISDAVTGKIDVRNTRG